MRSIIVILFVALVSSPATTNANLLTPVVDLLKNTVNTLLPQTNNEVTLQEYNDEMSLALNHAEDPLYTLLVNADRGIYEVHNRVYNGYEQGLTVYNEPPGGYTVRIVDRYSVVTFLILTSKGFIQSIFEVPLNPQYPVQLFTEVFNKIKAAAAASP
uniref:Putative secreted protein n=1 Tax=Nyssomyia neivai TaxID=330878 RepID=A0A1L8DNM7_9DIPT